jgi:general secretion pathway protein F
VLARLADFMEGQVKLKNKIVGALAYPAFMALMGVVILGVMMVVVVPKVSAIFDDFAPGAALVHRGAHLGCRTSSAASGGSSCSRAARGTSSTAGGDPRGALPLGRLRLRVPVFGELTRMVAISRFTRTLATLLSSGVPLLKAMDIVKNVMENRVLEAVITEANGEHQGGREHRRAAEALAGASRPSSRR